MGSIWEELEGLEDGFDQSIMYTYILFSNFKKCGKVCNGSVYDGL